MVCACERDVDLVRSRRKAKENDRPTGVGPAPPAINRDMQMADPGRNLLSLRTEYRNDLQIFGMVLNEHDPAAQRFGAKADQPRFLPEVGARPAAYQHPMPGIWLAD